ncbi:glycosyl transferase [Rhizobium azibense]|uniref:glycosyl transferase n=1 Tax=Rhizobium azibense TaxID=1136135 RepID=UPI001FE06262|nr:glycosyl transferase [Rhizobium azibense]
MAEEMAVSEALPAAGTKQVICINWGTKFGPPYINRLYAMVARNITPPFTFTCFTDKRDGIRPEVLCEDLPPLDVAKMPEKSPGIWNKARLWGETLGSLRGPVLFLDLDLVIVASLDPFFEVGRPDDVVMARNQTTPFEKLGQTSLFRFPVGKLAPLQEKFKAAPQVIADEYRFEQRFVTKNVPDGPKFFPREWVLHFRQDCRRSWPLNYFLAPRLPHSAKVVIFPRGLRPEQAISGKYHERGADNLVGHLMASFNKSKRQKRDTFFAHLRHFIRPTRWVADHWRE